MNTQETKTSFGKILGLSLVAGLISTIINVILFFIGKAAGFFPDTVLIPNQNAPLNFVNFIISSIVPSLLAGLVMGLIYRFAKNPKKVFNIISIVLLILSFANPFFIPAVPIMMAVMLNLMHVVVAVDLMYVFNKYIK
ncbi:MAG: hypothetical protein IPJ32_17620 [Sphingobacteriaceae bacterium]|nr:hypothetical protein [Sphingobacteriaceae bacterium]